MRHVRQLMKGLIQKAVQVDPFWAVINATWIRPAEYAAQQRRQHVARLRERHCSQVDEIRRISPNLAVRHGPFAGMRYPEATSIGSTIAPKLLGSYERELHPVIERLCQNRYSEIVDIGCAEGYYAVGMALRVPTARVYAFDTNADAVALCRAMAELNDVADRCVTGAFCDSDVLRSIPMTTKALIISDCEGYEKQLFSEDLVPVLAGHDLLIETHDCFDIETTTTLRDRFAGTHHITSIKSVDDIEKARGYAYEELRSYTLAQRKTLLAEHRSCIMEWFYMTPRHGGLAEP